MDWEGALDLCVPLPSEFTFNNFLSSAFPSHFIVLLKTGS